MNPRRMLSTAAVISACASIGFFFVHRVFAQQQSDPIADNVKIMMAEGRKTFRFETFGDEAFWGDTLKLHQAIEGSKFGGVGPGVSPKSALSLGLKVDSTVLPEDLVNSVTAGKVNLDDPAITLALLKMNAIVGVTGFFNQDGGLKSLGVQCAICPCRLAGPAVQRHALETGAQRLAFQPAGQDYSAADGCLRPALAVTRRRGAPEIS